MGSQDHAVQLSHLSCTFDDVNAVSDLSLDIRAGEFFSLIGPSGCGKTTTLRMVAGLQQVSGGTIVIHGRDVTNAPAFRRPVNTVFQHYALFPHLSVFENVAFGLRERRMADADVRSKVGAILELVGLSARPDTKPRQLSGGQQQRVALARALVLQPEVLLLDEPLGALDLKLRRQMQGVLKEIQREVSVTFVYVTHDQEEAFFMSDRVGVMCDGVLEQVGTAEEVYRRPVSAFVADFVGSSNHISGEIAAVLGHGQFEIASTAERIRMEAFGPRHLTVGDAVRVILRPECLHLETPESSAINARVVDISYLGPHTMYRLETPGVGSILVQEAVAVDSDRRQIGDVVGVTWSPQASWVVPAPEARKDLPTAPPRLVQPANEATTLQTEG
jgi:spermidine/putrescine transport system ATP-binding protein